MTRLRAYVAVVFLVLLALPGEDRPIRPAMSGEIEQVEVRE